jgi:hypothetical protein
MMPKEPLDFNNVESLRKQMLLNVTHMAKALTVSRVTYSAWVEGKPIRKGNDAKIRVILKRMLDMVIGGWPTPELVGTAPAIRFEKLMAELHVPEEPVEAEQEAE